ncbi:hypothetical protein JCM12298_29400 [Desulfothermus naphthae]
MIYIILTLDYEIFGNGAGDVLRHIIKPTDRILGILEQYNVPLTIMFEVGEYLKFQEYDAQIKKDKGYSYANAMSKHVIDAYQRGHDVQLHIHPQWFNAYYKSGQWIMDDPDICISEFSANEIDKIISTSKKCLENILKPIDRVYSCKVLRLTNLNWSEAPRSVFASMAKNNLHVHSLAVSTNPKNTKKGYWYLDKNYPIIEIPIHALKMPIYKYVNRYRIITALYRLLISKFFWRNNKNSKNNKKTQKKLSVKSILKKVFDSYPAKWDFCKQSSKEMIYFLFKAMEFYDWQNCDVPLVMISHSKDFFNSRNLIYFLEQVKKINNIKFVTFNSFIDILKRN